jgi:hypothetical protein
MKDRLFPLKPGTKEPAINDWQTKAGNVETNGNVGIATGDGLVVIDIDDYEAWSEVRPELGDVDFTSYPQVTTPRGGRHIYMRVDEAFTNANSFPKGIDVRGDGGFVVAPPTPGYQGTVPTLDLIPLAPSTVLSYLRPRRTEPSTTTSRDDLKASPAAWDRFNGHATNQDTANYLEQLGWTIGHTGRDDIIHVIRPGKTEGTSGTVGAVAPGVFYCHTSSDPVFSEETPYDAIHIYAHLHYGGDYAAADKAAEARYGGYRTHLTETERLDQTVELSEWVNEQHERVADNDAEKRKTGWASIALDLDDISRLPDLEWAVKDAIPEGVFSSVYGPTGIGKTFVCLDLTLTLASGADWYGQPSKQQNVLYLVGEGIRGYKKRIAAWLDEHPHLHPEGNITFSDAYGHSLRDRATIDGLTRYVQENRFTFVVVDTLNMFSGGIDENSAQEMSEMTTALTVLANDAPATVLAVHHTGKSVANGPRGSSVYQSSVNSSILVTRDPELPEITLHFDKMRDAEAGRPMKLEMYSVPQHESACLRISTVHIEQDRASLRTLLDSIQAHGPMTTAEAQHYSNSGQKRTRELLSQGVREGYLHYTEGRGRGSKSIYERTTKPL